MRNYSIIITLSFFILSSAFYFRTEVSGKVILRIGNVAITEYELKKNIDAFVSGYIHQHSQAPSGIAIKSWIDEFIDRTYFLADAYDKGYDTAHDINKWVLSMARHVISKPDGLLNEKIKWFDSVSEQELQSAMLNQLKEMHIPVDSLKNNVRRYLQLQKRKQQQAAYTNDIIKMAAIRIDSQVVKTLAQHLKKNAIITFEKSYFPAIYASAIFYFNQGNSARSISTAQLADYYNTLPMRREIKNVQELMFYIESFVYDEYAFAQAEAIGITRELKFQLDKRNYLNNVIWAAYEMKELKAGITVTDAEVQEKYTTIKDSFVQATTALVSVIAYENRKDAVIAMADLRSGKQSLKDKAQQLLYSDTNIHYNESFISDSIRAAVFNMKGVGVTMPVYYKGKYLILVKMAECGRRVQTLPEVQPQLIKIISAEKLLQKKQIRLKHLKAVYAVKKGIDYNRYLNKDAL